MKSKGVFVTNFCDFVRDFVAPQDIFDLICLIIKAKPFNDAIDVYSSKPIRKFKLLDYFVKNYFLRYTIKRGLKFICPTGVKSRYYSSSKKAAGLGYKPKFSSIKAVAMEASYMLDVVNK